MSGSKLRVGIIGCGGITVASHLPAYGRLTDQAEVVAVADVDSAVAEKVRGDFSIAKAYGDYEEMIRKEGLDAVTVATPNRFHLEPTLAALKAGVHVLCEKPLGMNGEQAGQMVKLAKEKGKILQVGLQLRFAGPVQFAKTFCDQGKAGDQYFARAQALRRRGVPSWGVFIDRDKQGGGPLIDIGVHILDLTLYLMGNPKPLSVSAQTWDTLGKDPNLYNAFGEYDRSKFTVEDFAVGLIRLEGGKVVSLESSFMANQSGDPFQTQLYGTKAGLLLRPTDPNGLELYTEHDRQLFDLKPANIPKVADAQTEAVGAFLKAVRGEDKCPTPGEQGYMLNAIFDAMYKSAETGKEEPVLYEEF